MMNFENYTELAKRTMNAKLSNTQKQLNCMIGICNELGELLGPFKKAMFQGHSLNRDEIISECGDVLWYVANLVDANPYFYVLEYEEETHIPANMEQVVRLLLEAMQNASLLHTYEESDLSMIMYAIDQTLLFVGSNTTESMESNINKLEKRFPNLRFESEKSVNR